MNLKKCRAGAALPVQRAGRIWKGNAGIFKARENKPNRGGYDEQKAQNRRENKAQVQMP